MKTVSVCVVGEALLSFKAAIAGSDGVLLHWKQQDPDPCAWKGVQCDAATKRVVFLSATSTPPFPHLGHLIFIYFIYLPQLLLQESSISQIKRPNIS